MALAPGYGVARLKVPPQIIGQKLSELGFGPKGKWEVAILLLQREKEILVNPSQREVIKPDDVLIVAGNHDKLEKLLIEIQNSKPEQE